MKTANAKGPHPPGGKKPRQRLHLDVTLPPEVTASEIRRWMETRGVTLHACRVVETATNTPVNLTGAEQLVLASFLDCNTIAEIAAHLHISPHTVHSHTKNLFAKLKARSRNVALGKALRAGVLRVEPCAGWQEEGEQ